MRLNNLVESEGNWLHAIMKAKGLTPGRILNDVDMSRPKLIELLKNDPITKYLRSINSPLLERAIRGDLTKNEILEIRRQMLNQKFML